MISAVVLLARRTVSGAGAGRETTKTGTEKKKHKSSQFNCLLMRTVVGKLNYTESFARERSAEEIMFPCVCVCTMRPTCGSHLQTALLNGATQIHVYIFQNIISFLNTGSSPSGEFSQAVMKMLWQWFPASNSDKVLQHVC